MEPTLKEILASYNAAAALQDAYTIPAPWYTDARIAQLELQNVFSRTWQSVGRTAQVEKPGTVCDRDRRGRADRRGARQRQQIARVLQRLPAPRHDRNERTVRPRAAHALPLSRLDLQSGRRTARHDGIRRRLQFRSRAEWARPGSRGDLGEFYFCESRSARRATAGISGRAGGAREAAEFRRT